jgi:two-component system, chemotaxis family, sensor kinase CheA
LRQPDADRSWDQVHLMRELTRVREAIDSYAKINEQSLGRKGKGHIHGAANAGRYVMVDKDDVQRTLSLLEQTNADELHELQSMRDTLRRTLRAVGSESVREALSAVLDSLPSLASELGKPAPVVRIDDNGYRLRAQAARTLSNVFVHLLRNSIDHGIEAAEARSAQGKTPAGTIDLEVGVDRGSLQITLSDDGRGLALERIRGIAVERGWIGRDDTLSDEAIADFIFRPGFSTAETVTEVSGRGVGMDAVRDFLRRENGSIELRFTDAHPGAPFRQFQTIVCLPDSVAVDTLGVHARGPAGELTLDTMTS